MFPAVVELRQDSKVHAPQGWGSGQALFSAFSTASACEMGVEQLEQEQLHLLSTQLQRHPTVFVGLQLLLGSTGTMFSIVTSSSSSCCWLRHES